MKNLIEVRPEGLYCKPGDFYIDAWQPVKQCIITHAHSDHAHSGHQHYISSSSTAKIIKLRMQVEKVVESWPYNKKVKMKECWISLHPAGHILGSSQVRIEVASKVCVVSGDYKRASDASCEPFSLQECDIFVTESTFALPIYNWEDPELIVKEIYSWWQENASKGLASILFCYALGKAQRLLSLFQKHTKAPIYVHGAIFPIAKLYEEEKIPLSNYQLISQNVDNDFSKELILAPPIAKGSPWMKRFFPYRTAMASGWMQVRGMRKKKGAANSKINGPLGSFF